ncbi:MAG: hypothetical protein Q4E62_07900, partial [Sutterellaceae bacterium]|nr:hypothetical protein [Sutterellaceae bacterium]
MEFGIDATMITDADIRIAGNQGVEFNNDATVGAASSDGSAEHGHIAIESASGDVVFADGAIVYGDRSFKANAGGNIVLTGDSDLNSDLLVELVAKGDILMRDSIRLGDNDSGQLTEKVVLEAGGNIVQSDIGADMGIVAQNLTATAGGDVSIGSTGIDGDTGNSFNAADIAAGGDVTIGVRDVGQTSIDINREKQGEVAGNVSIVAIDTDVKLGGIDVVGDVNIVAEGVTSDKIHAQGGVQIATSGYDHDATDGVRITSLTGSEVTVVTGEGEVAIGKLVTTEGNANIYRKETTVAGKVDLGQ